MPWDTADTSCNIAANHVIPAKPCQQQNKQSMLKCTPTNVFGLQRTSPITQYSLWLSAAWQWKQPRGSTPKATLTLRL
jgi:hypothetical protein